MLVKHRAVDGSLSHLIAQQWPWFDEIKGLDINDVVQQAHGRGFSLLNCDHADTDQG
tara:strand:- start:26 stop:196 length:171 start_codon:yes stop_codon:yes gene_type:complete